MEALGKDGSSSKSEPMFQEGIRAWAGLGGLRKQEASKKIEQFN